MGPVYQLVSGEDGGAGVGADLVGGQAHPAVELLGEHLRAGGREGHARAEEDLRVLEGAVQGDLDVLRVLEGAVQGALDVLRFNVVLLARRQLGCDRFGGDLHLGQTVADLQGDGLGVRDGRRAVDLDGLAAFPPQLEGERPGDHQAAEPQGPQDEVKALGSRFGAVSHAAPRGLASSTVKISRCSVTLSDVAPTMVLRAIRRGSSPTRDISQISKNSEYSICDLQGGGADR